MQSIVNAVTNATTAAVDKATSLVSHPSGATTDAAHIHAKPKAVTHGDDEASTAKGLPEGCTASEVNTVDETALGVFEDPGVRHAVLIKINQLAIDDAKHGLKEVAALELVRDGVNKGISFYHPQRYFTVHRPNGIDYIGEIEIEEGKSIHVRVHKARAHATPTFHSLDTRPSGEGGAVFKTGEPLHWFDY